MLRSYLDLKSKCFEPLKSAFFSFWESEAKRSKLFTSKFGQRKLLQKWYWSYFSSKANVLSFWKEYLSVCCKFLSEEVETIFGKVTQSVQKSLNQNLVIASFLENSFENIYRSKANVLSVWIEFFSLFFWNFLSKK